MANMAVRCQEKLGGGFKYFLFSPLFGEDFQSKLFGITYLVGKIKFKLLFHGPLAE